MKLSTKLLLAVLTLAVFALVGTNLALKAKYDRIDFKNPFRNYERVSLSNFKHLSLRSASSYPVEIRQGTEAQPVLYVSKVWKDSLKVEQGRDTLHLQFLDNGWNHYNFIEDDQSVVKATLILFTPQVQTLTVQRQSWLRLRGIRLDSLTLRVTADATVSLIDSRFNSLNLLLRDSAFADIQSRCQVGTLRLNASGKSRLKLSAESVGRFQPTIRDERVELRLSGKALTGLIRQAVP